MNISRTRHEDNTTQNEHPISTSTSTSPLPFITATQGAPAVSELTSFLQSTFLLPKTFSSPRMMNNNNDSNTTNSSCINDGAFSAKAAPKNIETNAEASNQEQRSRTTSSLPSTAPKNKKSVQFNTKISVHHLHHLPPSSTMAPREKSRIWYNSTYYDQFKYEAAKSAGVKIIRYDTAEDGNDSKASNCSTSGHHFVMMGDFDSKQGGKSTKASSSSSGNNSKKATSGKAGKCYYNENEYNDQQIATSAPAPNNGSGGGGLVKGGGEVICKRGLGYHFSRSRKKSRVVTRSAVMAWQTTLRDAKARHINSDLVLPSGMHVDKLQIPSSSADRRLIDKSQMMLALVSTKCSRVAREEARWRGDVDYRVAYPERHASRPTSNMNTGSRSLKLLSASASSSVLSATTHRSSNCTTTGSNTNRVVKSVNKRPNGMPSNKRSDDVDVPMNSCHKRQRISSQVSMGGCSHNPSADGGIDRDELSPNTIGLLSGVLHAEV